MAKKSHIKQFTNEELAEKSKRSESLSDWHKAMAMTEEELEAAIKSDPDEADLEIDWGKPLVDEDGEVREITADDLKLFRPSSEVLPPELLAILPKKGRPSKEMPKKMTTVRIDSDVIDWLKTRTKEE